MPQIETMGKLKNLFKQHSHDAIFKPLAGFGRAVNRFYENRNHRMESNGELVLLQKLQEFNPKLIIDGGANVGNYSKHLIQLFPDAKIHAFEPVKATFEQLKNNLKHHPQVDVHMKGLYSENCTQTINLFDSSTHSSLFHIQRLDYDETGTQDIDLIKGDDFLLAQDIQHIDFLKLDMEGAEYQALLGFEKALKEQRIELIQFEYGYINITTKKLLIDYYQLFEKYGYLVGKIFPKQVEFREYHFKYEDFLGPNFVAVKKSNQTLINVLGKK